MPKSSENETQSSFALEFLKLVGLSFLAVCLVILGVAGYQGYRDYLEENEYEASVERNERYRGMIDARAIGQPNACPFSHPFELTWTNNANATLLYTSFQFIAKRPGYSSSYYALETFNSDKIVGPKEEFDVCIQMPMFLGPPGSGPVYYEAKILEAEFQSD